MDVSTGVALVTGAAQGLGKAICEALLIKGCKVCCSDINTIKCNQTVQEFQQTYGTNCFFDKCDVSSEKEFEATYLKTEETFGNVNILVNNAAVANEKMIEINLVGVINGCNIAYEHMGKHNRGKGGAVVNVSSVTALMPFPFIPTYAATKSAVLALTRSFGHKLHYEKTGIKFTVICPSGMDTEMYWMTTSEMHFIEEFNKYKKDSIILHPSTVAEAVVQLVQDGRNGAVMTAIGGKECEYISLPEENLIS